MTPVNHIQFGIALQYDSSLLAYFLMAFVFIGENKELEKNKMNQMNLFHLLSRAFQNDSALVKAELSGTQQSTECYESFWRSGLHI